MSANSIYVLKPYKYEGAWIFDDETVRLVREPFVFGIDDMLDRLTAGIPNAHSGFLMLFSTRPFPEYMAKLEWRREEYGGNWYYSPTYGIEGWLCPALFKYFEKAPAEFYAKAESRKM